MDPRENIIPAMKATTLYDMNNSMKKTIAQSLFVVPYFMRDGHHALFNSFGVDPYIDKDLSYHLFIVDNPFSEAHIIVGNSHPVIQEAWNE